MTGGPGRGDIRQTWHSGGKTGGVVIRARCRHLPIQMQPAPPETRPEDPSGRRTPHGLYHVKMRKFMGQNALMRIGLERSGLIINPRICLVRDKGIGGGQ